MTDDRPLEELLSDEDAWPDIEAYARDGSNEVDILPANREQGERTLLRLQITTRSPMGAIAYHAAAIRVDHGWVTVHGATAAWNELPGETGVVVGHDAIGGFYVLSGPSDELPGDPGEVLFWMPDGQDWLRMERGYEAWLRWLFDIDLDDFYPDLRWPGWEQEVEPLTPEQGIFVVPPLVTKEGRDPARSHRGVVPVSELWGVVGPG